MSKIIVIVILLAALGGLIYFVFLRGAPLAPFPGGELPPTFPLPTTSTLPQGDLLRIGIARGTITVKNFYKDAVDVNAERDALVTRTPEYDITYFAADGSFIIGILALPFDEVRAKAEEAFLARLGISHADACRLTVFLAVPRWVDESLAGRNYRLSFCETGI